MNMETLAERIEQACGELGLSRDIAESIEAKALRADLPDMGEEDSRLREENKRLRQQVEALTAERDRMEGVEREMMELVKAPSREKILHQLRNILNELVLLQAMTEDHS